MCVPLNTCKTWLVSFQPHHSLRFILSQWTVALWTLNFCLDQCSSLNSDISSIADDNDENFHFLWRSKKNLTHFAVRYLYKIEDLLTCLGCHCQIFICQFWWHSKSFWKAFSQSGFTQCRHLQLGLTILRLRCLFALYSIRKEEFSFRAFFSDNCYCTEQTLWIPSWTLQT